MLATAFAQTLPLATLTLLAGIAPAAAPPALPHLTSAPPAAAQADAPQSTASDDRLVATLPKGYAYVRMLGQGRASSKLEYLPFSFSPDGSRVAFLAAKKDRVYGFLDGKDIGYGHKGRDPVFSDNGEHVIMALAKVNKNRSEKWVLYVDGSKAGNEDWVGPQVISNDGKSIAYWTKPDFRLDADGTPVNNRSVLVLGKRKSKKFRQKTSKSYSWAQTGTAPRFNEDHTRVLGSAYNEKGEGIILSVGGSKDEILRSKKGSFSQAAYTQDLKRIATVSRVYKRDVKGTTKRKKDSFPRYQLEVDDQLVEVEADALALPSFSPNGEHYSFVFLRHEKFGIGLNGKTLPVSENLILSAMPDSTGARVVWIEHRDGDLAKKYWLNRNVQNSIYQGKSHLCSGYVVDGDEGLILDELEFSDPYDKIHRYTFSPNEERVVFLAEVEKKYYVVCGAQQIGPFDGVDRIEWINEDQIGVGTREENEYWWRTMTVDD